ncbi:hypothetical protein B0H13DRAFT_2675074 [Mycena leptocephala]|nr:hypothetical protein B0H13DRAFT_2675074 [Mycena leptocephala]
MAFVPFFRPRVPASPFSISSYPVFNYSDPRRCAALAAHSPRAVVSQGLPALADYPALQLFRLKTCGRHWALATQWAVWTCESAGSALVRLGQQRLLALTPSHPPPSSSDLFLVRRRWKCEGITSPVNEEEEGRRGWRSREGEGEGIDPHTASRLGQQLRRSPRRSTVRATRIPIPPTSPHAYHVRHDPFSSLSVPVVTKRMGRRRRHVVGGLGRGRGRGEVKRLSVDAFATVGAEGARASGVNDGEGKEGGEYPLVVPRSARLVRALLNDQHAVKCATEWMKVWGVEEYILFDVLGYGRHALASAISAVCPDASADGFAIA